MPKLQIAAAYIDLWRGDDSSDTHDWFVAGDLSFDDSDFKILSQKDIILKSPNEYETADEVLKDIERQTAEMKLDVTQVVASQIGTLIEGGWKEWNDTPDHYRRQVRRALTQINNALTFKLYHNDKSFKITMHLALDRNCQLEAFENEDWWDDELICRYDVTSAIMVSKSPLNQFRKDNKAFLDNVEEMSVEEVFEILKAHANASELPFYNSDSNYDVIRSEITSDELEALETSYEIVPNIYEDSCKITLEDLEDSDTLECRLQDNNVPLRLKNFNCSEDITIIDETSGELYSLDDFYDELDNIGVDDSIYDQALIPTTSVLDFCEDAFTIDSKYILDSAISDYDVDEFLVPIHFYFQYVED